MECYYSEFTKAQTETLIKFCLENNLLISGGSDYHGDKRPEIKIGLGKNNLQIPYLNWI